MDLKHVSEALTRGLLAGYGGKSEFSNINRSGFNLKSSHYKSNAFVYHDEWSNGGGQELVDISGQLFTRVYAGGVASERVLTTLKVSVPQIINTLKHFLTSLTGNTRLFADCPPQIYGSWSYQYSVIYTSTNPQITVGKEVITFQNEVVFIHIFVLSPA